MHRVGILGWITILSAGLAACGDDAPDDGDVGAGDVSDRIDGGRSDAGRDGGGSGDGGAADATTCTSTSVPSSAPSVVVSEPYSYQLPIPTGPFAVGTHIVQLTDPERLEVATVDPDDLRRIVVQLYYPSDVRDGPPGPVMESEVAEVLVQLGGAMQDFEKHLLTRTSFDLPLSESQARWPVLLFSHGLGGLRYDDLPLFQELASHGYVVISLSHSYGSFAVGFDDGTVAVSNFEGFPSDPMAFEASFLELKDRLERDWVADTRLVLDELERWDAAPCSWLSGRFDLQRIGVLGMSFGGATAIQVCTRDTRCRAGLNLDGANFGSTLERTDVPLMMIHSDRTDPSWDPIHRQLQREAYSVRIFGSGHIALGGRGTMVQTLNPNVDLSLYGYGTLDVRRTEEIYRRYVRAFVDQHVLGTNDELLSQSSPYPEAFFERTSAGVASSVTVFGNVIATTGFLDPFPVPGASARLLGTSASTTANERGVFRFDGVEPVEGRVSILVEDSSLFPTVFSFPHRRRSIEELDFVLPTASKLSSVLDAAGLVRRPDRGHILIVSQHAVLDQPTYGQDAVQVTSTSTTARVYYGNPDALEPALTMTDPSGGAFLLNVEPGLWTGTIAHDALECAALPGGAPITPGELEVDVVAGALSVVRVFCQ